MPRHRCPQWNSPRGSASLSGLALLHRSPGGGTSAGDSAAIGRPVGLTRAAFRRVRDAAIRHGIGPAETARVALRPVLSAGVREVFLLNSAARSANVPRIRHVAGENPARGGMQTGGCLDVGRRRRPQSPTWRPVEHRGCGRGVRAGGCAIAHGSGSGAAAADYGQPGDCATPAHRGRYRQPRQAVAGRVSRHKGEMRSRIFQGWTQASVPGRTDPAPAVIRPQA